MTVAVQITSEQLDHSFNPQNMLFFEAILKGDIENFQNMIILESAGGHAGVGLITRDLE
ncbi:MAG: hypothetical protein IBX61_09015 [Thermoleophilia bacterium]|nr:hypothetical protein [Thermoleophilia bacterium]